MTWAVLDTNVLVSGLGWPRSLPGRIVNWAVAGRFMLVTSEPLLAELERVLAYPRLAAAIDDQRKLVRLVSEVAVIVEPDREVTAIEEDPADNRVLEAAVAALADCVVSGDSDLLELVTFEGMPILSPREFTAREKR